MREAHEGVKEQFQYRFDYSRWPLVVVPSAGNLDPALVNHESYYTEFDRFRLRGEPAYFLQDLRGVQRLDAARRRRFVEFVEGNAEELREIVLGYAVLVDSKLMSGVVTAVLWLVQPPSPMKVFSNVAEAEAWLLSLQGDAGDTSPTRATSA